MNSVPPPVIRVPPVHVPPPPVLAEKPEVVFWYRLWCLLFVVIWVGMFVYGALEISGKVEPELGLIEGALVRGDPKAKAELIAEKREDAIGVCAISLVAVVFYGVAAAVPRKPWGWVVGVVAVGGTLLPFIITAAGMVPILVKWGRPEVKRFFGKAA